MAGIYIHIPFCRQACHYCDFHFSTNLTVRNELIAAIAREAFLQRDYLSHENIETIYFGGGTPSILTGEELNFLLCEIQKYFAVSHNAEITLEANPDDLNKNKLVRLKNLGINRLSIGIQSFSNSVLSTLNRAHSAEMAKTCVKEAREAYFSNISIDLIYSIPGQNDREWISNIEQALGLYPEHISAYSLTIEDSTVFGNWTRKGKFTPMNDDYSATQMEILMDMLYKAGYEHYEISNFCLPGFQSIHNSSYWKQKKYLGLGPSAHSFDGTSRQYNISNNHLYVKALQKEGRIPFERENLTVADKINEYVMTSLRTSEGCNTKSLVKEYNFNLLDAKKEYIHNLVIKGLATVDPELILKLTRKGKLLADVIAADLFLS